MDQLINSSVDQLVTDTKETLQSDQHAQSTVNTTLPNRSNSTLQQSRKDFTTMDSRRASMKLGRRSNLKDNDYFTHGSLPSTKLSKFKDSSYIHKTNVSFYRNMPSYSISNKPLTYKQIITKRHV